MRSRWFAPALLFLSFAQMAAAFVFEVANGTVNECGPAQFTWSKGVAPYSLAVISQFDVASQFDIPDADVVEKDGLLHYNYTMPYDAGNITVFVMSDATGFATGGASGLFTVGPRPAGAQCTLRDETIPFYFQMFPENNKLPQCEGLTFKWTPTDKNFAVTYPITITGVIPNGQVLQWQTNSLTTTYKVNIAAGTQVYFAAWDAAGKQSGTSDMQIVTDSGDASCLGPNSPSSTPVQYPAPTKTNANGSAIATPDAPSSTTKGGVITVTATTIAKGAAGLSGGAIAGIVVGALVACLILQALILWFCCRRQIGEMRDNRKQKRLRLKNSGDVDLFEGFSHETNGHPGATGMAMLNHRTSHTDGSETISPFLGGSDLRSSLHTVDTQDLYAMPPQQYGYGHAGAHGSQRNSSATSSLWNTPGGPAGPPPGGAPASPISPVSGPSSASGPFASRLPSKLQLAMANPDNAVFEDHQPRQQAPTGGFRRHEDAGRLGDHAPEPDVEELPPNYNPEWENDSNAGSRR